ncbi:MAG TPA: hypothetical protein VLK84_02190 [Longimicrobium sp.]|nr:hypothetical protein [Longimicrobium sp.]
MLIRSEYDHAVFFLVVPPGDRSEYSLRLIGKPRIATLNTA